VSTLKKTTIRAYAKRIREDLRDLEAALKADDLYGAHDMASDAMGAAVEITSLIEYAQARAPWGYAADGAPRPPE
jgi:hypothetical protein